MIARKKQLFLLMDDQNRCYYVQGGVVKKNALPKWLRFNPAGAKDITLQFATNQKYLSTLRSFSNAVKFVDDGEQIILDRLMNGAGTEEIMYLVILTNNPAKGLNYYDLEYKSRLDFSKFNGDPHTGVSMNTLQDDVFSMVQANESNSYAIQCNATNTAALKVLFDGTLLQDKANYQVIPTTLSVNGHDGDPPDFTVPMTLVNNEGDSIGAEFKDQNFESNRNPNEYAADPAQTNYFLKFEEATPTILKGDVSFTWSGPSTAKFTLYFLTDQQAVSIIGGSPPFLPPVSQVIFSSDSEFGIGPDFDLVPGKTYVVPINVSVPLRPTEKLYFFAVVTGAFSSTFEVNLLSTNISALFSTKQVPTVNYGLRVIDVIQQLVSQITNGKYTGDSKYYRANNKRVILSGASLRSFPDATIQITFSDLYQSLFSWDNVGVTVRNGVLFIEPIEDIYNSKKELMSLGEVSKATLTIAEQFIYTSAKVGYVKQTYNKRNGRYESNCTHNYKFPIDTVQNQLNLVSPIRCDSFGMEFIRTGYPDLQSTDDKGDADLFATMITDEVGQADGEISTAIAFNVETLILASPVIKSPFSGTVIYNASPTITGTAQPFKIITVFVDGVIDGTAVVSPDGTWIYQIATVLQSLSDTFNGVHVITANAQTDSTNISGLSNVLSIVINTETQSPFLITSPTNNDTLYNNLPLISGIAQAGKIITLKVDGTTLTTVTANSSGIWYYQVVAAMADGAHVITATTAGSPDAPAVNIIVNKNVSSPLITNIVYDDIIYNNLPLIKGVAVPATTVSIYLDGGGGTITGGIAAPMGTAVADANGDWSFQVVSYTDPTGNVTDYIPDGLHILSTTPTPINVLAAITGFKLMRGSNGGSVMDYDAIRLDDEYIPAGVDPATLPPTLGQFLHPETLYNIEQTSPLRMLRKHDNILMSFLENQRGKVIKFNGAEVNANLVTKKGSVIYNEGANINVNDLSPNLFHWFILNFETLVPGTFNDIMTGISNDGYITVTFKGITIYLLPIGTMSCKPATDEAQQWKLLISAKTVFTDLIKIFSKGTFLNTGNNMVYFSDKNPLQFVSYNYTPPAQYHFLDIYDDWEKNRYKSWIATPDYGQPWQKSDIICIQAITAGVSDFQIKMYSVLTGLLVDIFPFTVPAGSLVALPNILQECRINLSTYPEGQYWMVPFANGSIIGIAEKIWLKEDWPKTFLFEYGGSKDEIDFYFSTGIPMAVRLQAKFYPWDPDSEADVYEDEEGDFQITRGLPMKSRALTFGNDDSFIPEWAVLKINEITLLDNVRIEGQKYTRNTKSKMEKVDNGPGFPNYMYKMEVVLTENSKGKIFATPGDDGKHTTAYVLDAIAFGQNAGVINVTAEEN